MSNNKDCLTCCGTCTAIIAALGVLAAAVSYYVFSIMFLVEDKDVADECKSSKLWVCILVTLVLSALNGKAGSSAGSNWNEEKIVSVILLFYVMCFEIAFAIWTGTELYVNVSLTLRLRWF